MPWSKGKAGTHLSDVGSVQAVNAVCAHHPRLRGQDLASWVGEEVPGEHQERRCSGRAREGIGNSSASGKRVT